MSTLVQNVTPNEDGLYEVGDMRLTEEQFKGPTFPHVNLGFRSKKVKNKDFIDGLMSHQPYLWKDRVIPYSFSKNYTFSKEEVKILENAVKHFNMQMRGCLKIRYVKSNWEETFR